MWRFVTSKYKRRASTGRAHATSLITSNRWILSVKTWQLIVCDTGIYGIIANYPYIFSILRQRGVYFTIFILKLHLFDGK